MAGRTRSATTATSASASCPSLTTWAKKHEKKMDEWRSAVGTTGRVKHLDCVASQGLLMAGVVDGMHYAKDQTEVLSSIDITNCFGKDGKCRLSHGCAKSRRVVPAFTIYEGESSVVMSDSAAKIRYGYEPDAGRMQKNVLACLFAAVKHADKFRGTKIPLAAECWADDLPRAPSNKRTLSDVCSALRGLRLWSDGLNAGEQADMLDSIKKSDSAECEQNNVLGSTVRDVAWGDLALEQTLQDPDSIGDDPEDDAQLSSRRRWWLTKRGHESFDRGEIQLYDEHHKKYGEHRHMHFVFSHAV